MRYYIEEALALAYGIVVSPKETLAVIVPEQRLREGIVIWSLSVMLSVVSVWVQWQDTAVWTAIAMYGGAAFCFAARILLYHGAARLLGRNGSMKSLAAALCFTELPLNLATLAGSFVFVAPELLVQAVSLAAGVWALVLDVWAVKETYAMGTGRSIAVLLLPLAAVAVSLPRHIVAPGREVFEGDVGEVGIVDNDLYVWASEVGAIALAVEPSRAGVIEGAAGKALGAVKLERLVRLHAGEGVAHVELVGVAYVDRRVETELLPRR